MYRLFLDDVRNPEDVNWEVLPLGPWVIVRSYDEFVKTITDRGLPEFISFDHDLADEHVSDYLLNGRFTRKLKYHEYQEKTGYSCAKWLVNYCLDNNAKLPSYIVHSMNNVGKDNIYAYFNSFKKSQSK